MAGKIHGDDELLAVANDLFHVLKNLRAATIEWDKHFGNYKSKKIYWQNRADELIKKLDLVNNPKPEGDPELLS